MCVTILKLFRVLVLCLNLVWARYFTKNDLHGVCIFTRRETPEQGQRGFRLSSLGILLARSVRPRPWRHVPALKALVRELQSTSDDSQDVWAPARRFFELRMARPAAGLGDAWHGWSEELDFDDVDDGEVSFSRYVPELKFISFFAAVARLLADAASPPPPPCAWTLLTHLVQTRSRSPKNTHIYTATRRNGVLPLPGSSGHVFRRPDGRPSL